MLFQGDGEEAHLRRRKQPREGVVVGNHLPLQVNWAGALEERSVMSAGDSLQEFDEGRAGQSWEGGHFQGWCRQWCRLDPLTLMVAWNGKAGKTVRRPPQAPGPPEGRGIVKLSPAFPPEAGCLQLELPCAAWGLPVHPVGAKLQTTTFPFALRSRRRDADSVRDETCICLGLTAQAGQRATAVRPISFGSRLSFQVQICSSPSCRQTVPLGNLLT